MKAMQNRQSELWKQRGLWSDRRRPQFGSSLLPSRTRLEAVRPCIASVLAKGCCGGFNSRVVSSCAGAATGPAAVGFEARMHTAPAAASFARLRRLLSAFP